MKEKIMNIENNVLKTAIFGAVRFEEENGMLKMSHVFQKDKKILALCQELG